MNRQNIISPLSTIADLLTSICEESTSNNDNNSSIINKELLNDKDNNINSNINKGNKSKDFSEFEIVDETSFNNEEIPLEKIPCIKQSQNSLTNNNNLYAELDS